MKKHRLAIVLTEALIITSCTLMSCALQNQGAPPQELLDAIARAESVYNQLERDYDPTVEQAAAYKSAMAEAKGHMNNGKYSPALKKARLARAEAEALYAEMTYQELQEYNPSTPMTYHYRTNMKRAEELKDDGKYLQSAEEAQKAREQARLSVNMMKKCLEDMEKKLAELKGELEHMYRPHFQTVRLYWESVDSIPQKDCEKTKTMVAELEKRIKQQKETTISQEKTFIVNSPSEFVRTYGDPVMYEEVTERGLRNEVNRVTVGSYVYFIKSKMVSRKTTYYYVKDPSTGISGWMAEERVWPERALERP